MLLVVTTLQSTVITLTLLSTGAAGAGTAVGRVVFDSEAGTQVSYITILGECFRTLDAALCSRANHSTVKQQ